MHYAVPVIFQKNGMLERLYTDFYATRYAKRLIRSFPFLNRSKIGKRLLGRFSYRLAEEKITHYPLFGIEYLLRQKYAKDIPSLISVYNWARCKLAVEVLKSSVHSSEAVYLYNGAGAELMKELSECKIKLVLEQTIAPFKIEQQLMFKEYEKYPCWNISGVNQYQMTSSFSELIAKEQAEWGYADKIICGSDFVKSKVNELGDYAQKLVVVPYGVDTSYFHAKKQFHFIGKRKLNVLVVGVGIRKGTQYILEACDELKKLACIRMIGALDTTPAQIKKLLSEKLNWIGSVPRADILKHYHWADLLLLPSVYEGSATVSYEALSMGIPVVATLNAGTLVEHGVNGYIVDAFNSSQIVEAVSYFYKPDVLEKCSINAVKLKQQYDIESYEANLIKQMNEI